MVSIIEYNVRKRGGLDVNCVKICSMREAYSDKRMIWVWSELLCVDTELTQNACAKQNNRDCWQVFENQSAIYSLRSLLNHCSFASGCRCGECKWWQSDCRLSQK